MAADGLASIVAGNGWVGAGGAGWAGTALGVLTVFGFASGIAVGEKAVLDIYGVVTVG
jgi:hypothetical protein